jgi:hypothetical protein
MHVAREGRRLSGMLDIHSWNGGPGERTPGGPCGAEHQLDYHARQPLTGTIDGERFELVATSVRITDVVCLPPFDYYLDRFSGTLVTEEDRLYAVWDDDHIVFHQRIQFRRVGR